MALKVVGAGVGRTGTHSLKVALQQLLGAPCYHMVEVFQHPEHVPAWHAAARGEAVDWAGLMEGYAAAVDWPASAFWPELAAANPDALIILSVRDPEAWWRSTQNTIFSRITDTAPPEMADWHAMVMDMMASRFTTELHDKEKGLAAFNYHNDAVKAGAPADRLLVWTATDGWEPICKALGLPVPAEPFPVTNTTEEFQARHAAPPVPATASV
jgi:hypothetical protein